MLSVRRFAWSDSHRFRARALWLGLALVSAGCAVVPAETHWARLRAVPTGQRLTTDDQVLRAVRPTYARLGQHVTVTIGHSDSAVGRDGELSYVKLVGFHAIDPGVYVATVESWCVCPWTAVLWGESHFPVFYPSLAVLGADGQRLTATVEQVVHRRPLFRATWVKGTWNVPLREAGPHLLMITSPHDGPRLVGFAGNTASHTSSPVGKVRVRVARIR
jgi:hypothetical protein